MRNENIAAKIKGAGEELLKFQQKCQIQQIASKRVDISRIEQVYSDLYLRKVRAKVEKIGRIMEYISGEISFKSVNGAEELQSEISVGKELSNSALGQGAHAMQGGELAENLADDIIFEQLNQVIKDQKALLRALIAQRSKEFCHLFERLRLSSHAVTLDLLSLKKASEEFMIDSLDQRTYFKTARAVE